MWVGLKVDVTGWNSNVGGAKGRLWLVGESKGSLWLAESRMQVIFVFFRTELLDIWQGIADPQAFGPREEPPWSGRENNMCRSDERLAGESNICLSVREEPRPARESTDRINMPQHSLFMSTQVCEGLCDTNTLTNLKLLPLFCRM